MKLWILAGLFTITTVPFAAASQTDLACEFDARRVVREEIAPPAPPAPPAPLLLSVRDAPKADRLSAQEINTAPAQRARAERRRNGSVRRIPDALLIGGGGVL